jgi:diacylglycerol kinase (ATP)
MKSTKQGFSRILAAGLYSADGFQAAWKNEEAFRQELVLFILLLPALYFLPVSLLIKGLLLAVNVLVLIVELLNSGIEAIVDLASPEFHILAKRAKDMGSAAVFLSLLLASILWGGAIFSILQ